MFESYDEGCNCSRCIEVRENNKFLMECLIKKPETAIEAWYQKKAWERIIGSAKLFKLIAPDNLQSNQTVKFNRVLRSELDHA